MQDDINYEQVSIRLANRLATALYQQAVLETANEQLTQAQGQETQHIPGHTTTEDSSNE